VDRATTPHLRRKWRVWSEVCGRQWRLWRRIRLDSFILDLINLLIVENLVSETHSTIFLAVVDGSFVLGLLLYESIVCVTTLQVLGDEVFVYDVSLELRGRDDVAVSELEMLNEETCAVERLLAADAGQTLVKLVVL
jgi:hypothetical protein